MSLKKSRGNMYPWVTHTHSHLVGECPYKCEYCYVGRSRFGRPAKYQGPMGFDMNEFVVNYGSGKVIFIDNTTDMFAAEVPLMVIQAVLDHCRAFPENTYVFQTKNPMAAFDALEKLKWPKDFMIGVTIETNRSTLGISSAPATACRMSWAKAIRKKGVRTFITIEPIMDFDPDEFLEWIAAIKPEFVNIGADSKRCGLLEPSWEKVEKFIHALLTPPVSVEVRGKGNLSRLMKEVRG